MGRGGVRNIIEDGALGIQRSNATGVFCAIGVSEKGAGTIQILGDPVGAKEKLGGGPLTDLVASALSIADTICYALPVAGSVAGTVGAITVGDGNRGVGGLQAAGAPKNTYTVNISVESGGGLNEATFRYVLDGVRSDAVTVPADGIYTIPGTGITLTFTAGSSTSGEKSFETGDTFTFNTTAPSASQQEILNAVDVLLASTYQYEWISISGDSGSALWAALAVKAIAAEKLGRYIHFKLQARAPNASESVDQWVGALTGTERGTAESSRLQVYAGWIEEAGPFGSLDARAGIGLASGMSSRRQAHQPVDATKYGAVPGIRKLLPEGIRGSHIDALDDAGYTTFCTYPGQKGVYITHGRTLAGLTSDFGLEERRRVMDYALSRVQDAQFRYINSGTEVGADGSLEGIEMFAAICSQPLRLMEQAGMISGGEIIIDRNQDILATQTIKTRVRIRPLGKMSWIENTIGFFNPNNTGDQ